MRPFFARSAAAALLLLPLIGCGEGSAPSKGGAPKGPVVTVASPVQRNVVEMDEYVGRFVAIDSVEVRARVSGYLDKVHFTDGASVKQGERLFSIDPRPFAAALDQARANLERAKAQSDLARAELARAQSLIGRQTISEALYEQRVQAKRAADAQLQAAEAEVRTAALNLEFTELRAPITGRIGARRVSPGNLVIGGSQPSTTLLATIVSLDPIYFEFSFDEAAYLRYVRLANGNGGAEGQPTAPIELRLLDEPKFAHRGTLNFVDNALDPSSGTIRGRALVPNPHGVLAPGMFARARIAAGPPYAALLVPDQAIGTEQVRKFVYVVDEQNIVRQKFVTLGPLDGGMRVVARGLDAKDRVIVNGMMRARPGNPATPIKEGETPPGAPAKKK